MSLWFGVGLRGAPGSLLTGTCVCPALARTPIHYVTKHLQQGIESDHFRLKKNMPRVGSFRSFSTARRTIQGFEAMLWLRKGFGFAGDVHQRDPDQVSQVRLADLNSKPFSLSLGLLAAAASSFVAPTGRTRLRHRLAPLPRLRSSGASWTCSTACLTGARSTLH